MFSCLLRSASDWNLPLRGFDFRRNQFLFLCSFQGAPGFRPDPFAAAVPSPQDRLQRPPVGVGQLSHLGLRFLIFMRTLKTIQTRDSFELQSDALACSRLPRLYQSVLRHLSMPAVIARSLSRSSHRPKDSSCHSHDISSLPRKEVIQPHLPIRLPCYDFTPVIGLTFGS